MVTDEGLRLASRESRRNRDFGVHSLSSVGRKPNSMTSVRNVDFLSNGSWDELPSAENLRNASVRVRRLSHGAKLSVPTTTSSLSLSRFGWLALPYKLT